jgi:hypothetical protein
MDGMSFDLLPKTESNRGRRLDGIRSKAEAKP